MTKFSEKLRCSLKVRVASGCLLGLFIFVAINHAIPMAMPYFQDSRAPIEILNIAGSKAGIQTVWVNVKERE